METLNVSGPIPITLVAGFLGAGKTTLVNRLVAARQGERIGVIVNEAGEIGLDGELLGEASDDVEEIADGCVCCTSHGDLVEAIERLRRRAGGLDRLILETSGLADPGPVLDTLSDIMRYVRLDTMIGVVDAVHALIQLDQHESPEALRQVELATHLVVTKADLADEGAVEAVCARVRSLNPTAEILISSSEPPDTERLLDRYALSADDSAEGGHDVGHHHGHDHEHLEVEMFAHDQPGELDPDRFDAWLAGLLFLNADDLFRIKGILAMAGNPHRHVLHGVHTYVESAPGREWAPDEERSSRLVVIGRNLEGDRWRADLARCAA